MQLGIRYMFPVSDDEVAEFQIANRLKPAGLAFTPCSWVIKWFYVVCCC